MEVFFVGSVAMMYVNDVFLGTADISSVNTSGDVSVAYGIYADDARKYGGLRKLRGVGFLSTTSDAAPTGMVELQGSQHAAVRQHPGRSRILGIATSVRILGNRLTGRIDECENLFGTSASD